MISKTAFLLAVGLWVALFAIEAAKEGASIAPKAILKILMDIRTGMHKNEYQELERVEINQKLQVVNALIDIAAIDKTKCSHKYFEMVDPNLRDDAIYLKNFVIHNRQAQLKLCKTVLNDTVNQLSENEAQQLLDLKNEIILSKKDALEQSMSGQKVAQGLASYLELNANLRAFGDAATLRQEIRNKVYQLIAVGCNKLLKGVGQMSDIKLFTTSDDSIKELDQYTLDWISTGRICYFIGSNLDSVLDGTLKATLSQAQESAKPIDECSQLYEQLLTATAARSTIRPEQVISFLDNLIQVCGSCSDEASIKRAKMGELIKEFHIVNLAKCTHEKFEEFAFYGSQTRQGTVLEGYLLDLRDRLVEVCTQPVAEMASHLDKLVLRDMIVISANIVGWVALNPAALLQINPEQVRTGLSRLFIGLKSVVPKEQLTAEFLNKLNNACQATTLILGQLKDLYLTIANYPGLHLDETIQTWLTHYRVCNSITPMIVSSVVSDADNAGFEIQGKFSTRRGF